MSRQIGTSIFRITECDPEPRWYIRLYYIIEVRKDVLQEKNGPMLIHGLQGLHSNRIVAPKRVGLAPDPKLLEERFEMFRRVG